MEGVEGVCTPHMPSQKRQDSAVAWPNVTCNSPPLQAASTSNGAQASSTTTSTTTVKGANLLEWKTIPQSQTSNLLLRLPAELRNDIYKRVLGGRRFKFKDALHTRHARLDNANGDRHVLALLYVCKQIYFETALLPYALNVFVFREFERSLRPFLRQRSPAQFRVIYEIGEFCCYFSKGELLTYRASQMWAEYDVFSDKFAKEADDLCRIPNLRRVRVVIDTMSSLFIECQSRYPDCGAVRRGMDMIEGAIEYRRPDVIVGFWWA